MSCVGAIPFLRNLELRGFQPKPQCPKCGVISGELVTPNSDRFVYQVKQVYCRGGLEPTFTHQVPLDHNGQMTDCEHTNTCAGLKEEHFHCECGNCGYEFFMEVRPDDKPAV